MVDSARFATFTEKAKQNIDQIKIGLLRHDRHPKDREFLNDISKSVHSIKNAAQAANLPRITELCHNLENLINLIKEEKKELHQEIIITIAACKDRLIKFIFELETVQMERAKVKDLVNRIQQHVDDYKMAEFPETAPALSGFDSSAEPEPAPSAEVESSLLPEEVINKDYDKELFQIFIGQVQENISLLRTLTDSFPDAANQTKIISQCSDLAGKLQSSANYMSYDRLADFYLQWVAELEMAGVELSMGNPVNLDFMDQNIKKIAELFPEINDKPADPAELLKVDEPSIQASAGANYKEVEFSADADDMQEMFGSLDEIEDEEFEGEAEPIAALSGEISPEEEEAMAAGESSKPLAVKKQARGKKTIEIDSSFLEEEKQSEGYDEELFQIFVQQLQENISQLQNLTDSFAAEPNKSNIIDKCSNLVGKLQSSANYMGYERLAEFYLQWIAELEMTGVELSIGSDISFDFMQEKIDRIVGLFPEAGGSPSARSQQIPAEKAPVPEPVAREEIAGPDAATAFPDDHEVAKVAGEIPVPGSTTEIFAEDEEDEEEPLAEGIEPVAGLSDEELVEADEITGALFDEQLETADAEEPERGEFSEAVDEKLESFFADIEEPESDEDLESSFMAIASLSEEEPDEETPSGEIASIAGLSDLQEDEPEETVDSLFVENQAAVAEEAKEGKFKDDLDEELDSFFADLQGSLDEDRETSFTGIASVSEEEGEPAAPAAKAPASADVDANALFDEEEEEEPLADGVEPIAGVPDEEAENIGEINGALFDEQPAAPAAEESERGEFSEAVDDQLESFFADIEEPEGDEDLESSFMEIASFSGDAPEEETVFTAEPPGSPVVDELFAAEEEKELPTAETEGSEDAVAELFELEPDTEYGAETTEAEIAGPAADDMVEGIDAFFDEEHEAEPEAEPPMEKPAAGEVSEDFEAIFTETEFEESEEASLTLPEETGVEVLESGAEEEGAGPAADDILEGIDDFFDEKHEVEPEAEPPEEGPVADEMSEGLDEEMTFSEEEIADEDTVAAHPGELLSDEELLEEIEGPTVGEQITPQAQTLLSEFEGAEEVLSSLPEDQQAEEELFRKLEGAISAEEEKAEDIEDLTVDEDIFDEDLFDESETAEAPAETPPQRRELFQKLSHALQSLEEESEFEDFEEVAAEPATPSPEAEFDHTLFDRLISALEAPSEQAEISGARPMDHVLEEILSSTPVNAEHAKPVAESLPGKLAPSEIRQIIRMDTDKVDHLMNQLGELNANRSTLIRLQAEMDELHHHYREMDGFSKQELKPLKDLIFRLGDTSASLHRLSSEIREGILKVKTVPIGLLFDRYHQYINTLAAGANKQVELEIAGADTELEKVVADEISEPLSHLISNMVEHGIEPVAERKQLGKDETGKIELKAYHRDNEIVIEIMDDGRGLDIAQIKAKALEQGLFTGDELFKMSDSDLKRLILHPGFSTVVDKGEKPDYRGEGLYIVNKSIEKLKGTIDIRSRKGKGTLLQIRIPLNLLVIKALKTRAGKEIMALPVNSVDEILKVRNDDIHEENGRRIITIHDTTLPVFSLTEIFNIEPVAGPDERTYIIIVTAEGQSIGLIVDETLGLEEIIIKPLGEFLRRKSGFSGATIISDGNISLIPDIAELMRIAAENQPIAEESIA